MQWQIWKAIDDKKECLQRFIIIIIIIIIIIM